MQLAVAHKYIGVATALITTSRSIGRSVGTTIYTSILRNKLQDYIVTYVATPLAKSGVPLAQLPAIIKALTSGNVVLPALGVLKPQQLGLAAKGLKQAFAHSFKFVYLVTIAFGVAGTISVAFTANIDHLMTKHVDIKLEKGAHIYRQVDTGEGHIIKHPKIKG